MTARDFDLITNSSVSFDATQDSLNINSADSTNLTISSNGTDLTFTRGSDFVTLLSTTLAQITTSNLTLGTATSRPVVLVGDNNTGSVLDASGNTITTAAQNFVNANNIIFGMGGSDNITADGTGDQIIYGGTGIADSTDGNDTISVGTGGNTIFANAGNDVVTFNGATVAGKTVTAYLGIGNDNLTDVDDNGSNFLIFGNSGNDTIDLANAAGDHTGNATLYGGNGIADSTDGDDAITGGDATTTVYANSGNDTVASYVTGNNTFTGYLGLGNDSYTNNAAGTADTTNTVIYAGPGMDTVTMTTYAGDATVFGGTGIADSTDGADTITAGIGNFVIYANAGDDSITDSGARAATTETTVLYAGLGDDTITSTSNTTDNVQAVYYGNTGNDVFNLDQDGGTEWDYTIGDFESGDVVNITLSGGTASALSVAGGGSSPEITNTTGGSNESVTFQGYSGDFSSTNFVISDGSILATNFSGTAATLTGGATTSDYLISGTSGDTIVGNETVAGTANKYEGNGGDDVFQIDDAVLSAMDATVQTISGGDGTDTLQVTGSSAAALANADLDNTTLTSIEKIVLNNIDDHSLVLADETNTSMGLSTIDGSALTGTNNFTVNDNSEFAASLVVIGGAGADAITRSQAAAQSDNFSLAGGNDTVTTIVAQLGSNDTIDGGSDTDTFVFTDAGTFADSAFTGVTAFEAITLADGDNTFSSIGSEMDEAGITTIDGSNITTGTNSLVISANTSTENMSITGGAGKDTLIGGTGNDTLAGGASEGAVGSGDENILTGGAGSNDFVINQTAAAEATTITDWTAGTTNELSVSISAFTDLANAITRVGTTAQLAAEDWSDDTDGQDDIIAINDQGYTTAALAYAAIDDAATATGLDANDELMLIFYDSDGGYTSVFYDDDLSNDFTGAIEVARITDLDSIADLAAAFTGSVGGTDIINEINLVA